eukprot:7180280-Pyramimonas_sp.AAC.1
MILGARRHRGHTSGKGKGRRGSPKDANGRTMECNGSTNGSTSASNALRAMVEAEVRRCVWLKLTRIYSMWTGGRFWPTLPIAQLQLLTSWLPEIRRPACPSSIMPLGCSRRDSLAT